MTAIDISVPVFPGMLHPGRQPETRYVERISEGDPGNVTRWYMGAHTGTHVEAPLHTDDDGAAIDALPLELLVGPARVLDLTAVETEITAADLIAAGLGEEQRVLLKTTNSDTALRGTEAPPTWVGLAPEGAELLVARGVKLVGIDFFTIETPGRDKSFDSHYILSAAGVSTIEQVDLAAAAGGLYELICLPIPIAGAEAAPARAVLLPLAEAAAERPLTDVSVPVHGRMLHWGRRPVREIVESIERGDACNVTRWDIGSHTGLHVDAGLHFDDSGAPIDELELDVLLGPARVLDLTAVETEITAADLIAAGLGEEERVLLKTRNSATALQETEKPEFWIGLAPDGAELLVARGRQAGRHRLPHDRQPEPRRDLGHPPGPLPGGGRDRRVRRPARGRRRRLRAGLPAGQAARFGGGPRRRLPAPDRRLVTAAPDSGGVALAAPHALAIAAGEEAARAGGNALDAALAAAAVLVVAYPHQCALGGDLTALVRDPDGAVTAVLSLGAAPAAVDAEALRAGGERMPRQGALTVTVPGIVAGWRELAGLGSRLGLRAPLLRAAALAAEGTAVAPGLARAIADRLDAIVADPGLAALFLADGEPLAAGAPLVQPALARTLEAIAAEPSDFYDGEIAAALVAFLRAGGSAIAEQDFAAHAAEQRRAADPAGTGSRPLGDFPGTAPRVRPPGGRRRRRRRGRRRWRCSSRRCGRGGRRAAGPRPRRPGRPRPPARRPARRRDRPRRPARAGAARARPGTPARHRRHRRGHRDRRRGPRRGADPERLPDLRRRPARAPHRHRPPQPRLRLLAGSPATRPRSPPAAGRRTRSARCSARPTASAPRSAARAAAPSR